MKKSLFIVIAFSLLVITPAFSQDVLKSTEEEYYDFLSLLRIAERPTLGYRTLSDSVWNIDEETDHIWSDNNLGTTKIIWQNSTPANNWFTNGLFQGVKYKIFGPDWYNSYNS
nr:hypothetical protein [Treponema sp.]